MTIHFHDISSFQGNYDPTGPTIAKATEGSTWTDQWFVTNRLRTIAHGWPFLAYHFLWPGDIPAQVAHANAVIGAGQPLMLDVETTTTGAIPTLADVLSFMDLHGHVTLVYLPQWFWSGHWGSPSLAPIAERGAGLISSNYTTYSDTGPGWAPYGGMTPVIWQYTADPIDTNAYRGSQDELAAVFTGQHLAPTPPPEDDMALYFIRDAAGQAWLADGITRRPVAAKDEADVGHVVTHEAQYQTATPQAVDNPDAFGLVAAPPAGAAGPSAAEIAKAVNDDAAARLAQ